MIGASKVLTFLLILIALAAFGADIHVIVKIESADAIPNLHSIITASDGVSWKFNLFLYLNFP